MTLGKQPRAEHCFIIEKVPVIIAWLPTTAASIAITRTGHLNFSAKDCDVFSTQQEVPHYQYPSNLRVITTYQVQKRKIQYDSHH